jgi:hypothetical protein
MLKPIATVSLPGVARTSPVFPRPAVRSMVRACAAAAIAVLDKLPPARVAKREWSDDLGAEWLLRAPVQALDISTAPALVQTVMPDFLMTLVSQYVAAAKIFKEGLQLSFGHAASISVPTIIGDPSLAAFIQEGYPIPVVQPHVEPLLTLTPHKIAGIVVLTTEMVKSSNIENLMADALTRAVGLALDSALLDAQPATAERPAGLRYNRMAIAADPSPDPVAAMVADISNLIVNLAPILTSPPLLVQSGARTMTAQLLSHHGLDPLVTQGSVALRMTTDMIMLAPNAVVSVTGTTPEITSSREVALQMDNAPLDGVSASMWQKDCMAVKVRLPITWGLRIPGAVSWLTATHW